MSEPYDLDKGFLVRHRHLVLYLEPDESGGYVVTSPFVPGLTTQGDTFEETIAMALDADEALREARAELRRVSATSSDRAMKRTDLERHLRDRGCDLLRHGGRHDVWINPATEQTTAVPRHREVKPGTVRAICRDLDVPLPTSMT